MSNQWDNRIQKYSTQPASQFTAHPNNPRIHPQEQRKAVNASLNTLGWVAPVVVNARTGYLLDGHERLWQALAQGEDTPVPFVEVDISEEEERQFLATFDFITYLATFDKENLKFLVDNIETDDAEIENLLDALSEYAVLEDDDVGAYQESDNDETSEADELAEKWGTALGQIWAVRGDEDRVHYVLCGDSTDEPALDALFAGRQPDLIVTDPPYGVSIGDKNKMLNEHGVQNARNNSNIINDNISPDDLHALLVRVFSLAKTKIADDASFYATAPQGGDLGMMMLKAFEDAGLPVRHTLIWVKNAPTFSMGRLDYDYQHEPIFYGWNKKHDFQGKGEHTKSVWFYDKPRASRYHPTMKPIPLFINAILNSSRKGDAVFDPFLGSGTTLLASEHTGRVCYGVELSPSYLAVILERATQEGMECSLHIDLEDEEYNQQ